MSDTRWRFSAGKGAERGSWPKLVLELAEKHPKGRVARILTFVHFVATVNAVVMVLVTRHTDD